MHSPGGVVMLPMLVTDHARTRQAQRNLSDEEVTFVLDHGQSLRSGGALHIFLGRRDMPSDQEGCRRYQHLEGAVLVLNDMGDAPVLITVYRNRRGLREIRRKTKYRSSKDIGKHKSNHRNILYNNIYIFRGGTG